MNVEKAARYVLIGGAATLVIGVGGAYYSATRQPIGDACPTLVDAPEGLVFADRSRTEQRLDLDYDLRPANDGTDLSCLNVLGQAKCTATGPAIMAGQLGYRGDVTYFSIPAGRTAVVRLSNSRMLCVMPDP